MQKIKKGDTVEVIAGKDLGAKGEVLVMLPKEERVVVERVNIVKRHRKPRQTGGRAPQQGIQEFEAPLHISNVMLVCKQCGETTRVGFHFNEEKRKVRFCKKCKQDID